jgi:hypothetical protein
LLGCGAHQAKGYGRAMSVFHAPFPKGKADVKHFWQEKFEFENMRDGGSSAFAKVKRQYNRFGIALLVLAVGLILIGIFGTHTNTHPIPVPPPPREPLTDDQLIREMYRAPISQILSILIILQFLALGVAVAFGALTKPIRCLWAACGYAFTLHASLLWPLLHTKVYFSMWHYVLFETHGFWSFVFAYAMAGSVIVGLACVVVYILQTLWTIGLWIGNIGVNLVDNW